MPQPGPPAARGHLRLAGPPADRRRAGDRRALLALRGASGVFVLAVLTVLAWIFTAAALVPVAWRRAPVGVRLRPLRVREARVIPFQRPRQKALPR